MRSRKPTQSNEEGQGGIRVGDSLLVRGLGEYAPPNTQIPDPVKGSVITWANVVQTGRLACVVALDAPTSLLSAGAPQVPVLARFLVLKLRYAEASWGPEGVVNVSAKSELPGDPIDDSDPKGWIAAHCIYERVA